MKVVATIAAVAKSPRATAAVDITCEKFKHTRVIPFTKATANQAELFALGYVLASIKDEHEDVYFEVTTSNQYVSRILDKDKDGQYAVTPEKNIELVKEVRDLATKRPRVTLFFAKAKEVNELKLLIKETETANAK